jgi:hypothetical protein
MMFFLNSFDKNRRAFSHYRALDQASAIANAEKFWEKLDQNQRKSRLRWLRKELLCWLPSEQFLQDVPKNVAWFRIKYFSMRCSRNIAGIRGRSGRKKRRQSSAASIAAPRGGPDPRRPAATAGRWRSGAARRRATGGGSRLRGRMTKEYERIADW